MKTTQKHQLQYLLEKVAKLTHKATSKNDAIEKGLISYLYLDNNPTFGGLNLVSVMIDGGGHSTSFKSFSSCGNRIKPDAMIQKMESFIDGLEYTK